MTVPSNGSFTGDPAAGTEVLTVGTVNGRVASYVWGPDIASRPDGHSSWQRAGGVGGLLMVVDGNGTWPGIPATTDDHFFPLMDRLGNVTGCRKAATGLPNDSLSAVLEYDAFGQEVRSTGPASDLVLFHFSTKFTDQESGLNYYGYRYYDSGKGRWLSRDPVNNIEFRQFGGNMEIIGDSDVSETAVYGVLDNNVLSRYDVLGLLCGPDGGGPINRILEWLIPDKPGSTLTCGLCSGNFEKPCLNHDRCYATLTPQEQCDAQFYKEMLLECRKQNAGRPICTDICEAIAGLYRKAVGGLGGKFRDSPQTREKQPHPGKHPVRRA
ncbi:MAG: hypothetical protein K1X53_12690 [Candidatus Sumerlaeaceae bacterium]|nr:hypothetical protein [Candidatus Sumerlaeaceae bacterium]